MYTTLKEIEMEYLKRIQNTLGNSNKLTAELLLNISISLFAELKIKGISDSKNKNNDMLLYQYGIYDWGDKFGKHFSLDITRQFFAPKQDEPYQLSFALIYNPEQFKDINSYNCWSDEYKDIDSFATNIKTTDGFKMATKNIAKTYQISFEQC